MTCENCGALMHPGQIQGMLVCDYCGARCEPPADEIPVRILRPSAHGCPVCHVPLAEASMESCSLLFCPQCHGMMFQMDAFPPVIEHLRSLRERPAFLAPRDLADSERFLGCPVCGRGMDNHPYGGGGNVNVDTCEDCEVIWLDRGELHKIVAAPDFAPSA